LVKQWFIQEPEVIEYFVSSMIDSWHGDIDNVEIGMWKTCPVQPSGIKGDYYSPVPQEKTETGWQRFLNLSLTHIYRVNITQHQRRRLFGNSYGGWICG
jgi:hypothetical protein